MNLFRIMKLIIYFIILSIYIHKIQSKELVTIPPIMLAGNNSNASVISNFSKRDKRWNLASHPFRENGPDENKDKTPFIADYNVIEKLVHSEYDDDLKIQKRAMEIFGSPPDKKKYTRNEKDGNVQSNRRRRVKKKVPDNANIPDYDLSEKSMKHMYNDESTFINNEPETIHKSYGRTKFMKNGRGRKAQPNRRPRTKTHKKAGPYIEDYDLNGYLVEDEYNDESRYMNDEPDNNHKYYSRTKLRDGKPKFNKKYRAQTFDKSMTDNENYDTVKTLEEDEYDDESEIVYNDSEIAHKPSSSKKLMKNARGVKIQSSRRSRSQDKSGSDSDYDLNEKMAEDDYEDESETANKAVMRKPFRRIKIMWNGRTFTPPLDRMAVPQTRSIFSENEQTSGFGRTNCEVFHILILFTFVIIF